MEAIRSHRTLLADPNPIPPLLNKVSAALRKTVSEAHGRLRKERDREVAELEASDLWLKLNPEDGARILESNRLGPIPDLDIGTDQSLINCLEDTTLQGLGRPTPSPKDADRPERERKPRGCWHRRR